jgi:hypothetical protein
VHFGGVIWPHSGPFVDLIVQIVSLVHLQSCLGISIVHGGVQAEGQVPLNGGILPHPGPPVDLTGQTVPLMRWQG